MSIGLVFLLAVIAIALLALGIVAYATKLVSLMVDNRHAEAEEIMASGRMPRSWWDGSGRRMTKARALRRLVRIVAYCKGTPAVADAEARRHVVASLGSVLMQWREANLQDILPAGTDSGQGHEPGPTP